MFARMGFAFVLACMAGAAPVLASKIAESEPVLRLRLSDPLLDAAPKPFLRPRFSDNVTAAPASVPMPAITVEKAGRVGNFAYISTPHPNLVVAIGATEDRSELGRQIDRAIIELTPENRLYPMQQDSAPFIGFGMRAGQRDRGWAVDATVGAGLLNAAEHGRLTDWGYADSPNGYEAEARGNVRVRYRF
ncbi:MAG: hypothetical protein AAF269_07940 [Pseudomonadota bacterium]